MVELSEQTEAKVFLSALFLLIIADSGTAPVAVVGANGDMMRGTATVAAMMFNAETQDYLDQRKRLGPAQPPATLGEARTAAWGEAWLHSFGGAQAQKEQALNELRSAYRSATGSDPRDEARKQGIPIDFAKPDEEAGVIRMLARGLPDEAQKQLAPHLDLDAKAAAVAARTERVATETSARTFGFSANAITWLAGLVRFMIDPPLLIVVLAVSALVPLRVSYPAFFTYMIGIMVVTGAVLFSIVSRMREDLGLSADSFSGHVALTVAAGLALAAVFRPIAQAIKRRIT